ncbi:phosphate acetyltransferase [Schlesneria sp. T3-172]|uniref:phosphate acetyltransferase n=1 Tax=Schlesneria sphaerica TaxID=3373610 RepID=UPI0037CBF1A7
MMKKTIFLVPVHADCGLTTVALGMVRAFDQLGVRVAFYKPLDHQREREHGPERSTHFVRTITQLQPSPSIPLDRAERLVSAQELDRLRTEIITAFHQSTPDAEVVIVEGLVSTRQSSIDWNEELVGILSADVVLVAAEGDRSSDRLRHDLETAASPYGGMQSERVMGCILNRVRLQSGETGEAARSRYAKAVVSRPHADFSVIGCIPYHAELTHCRPRDIAAHLKAEVVFAGEIDDRRVKQISLLARRVPHLFYTFRPGAILVTPADRDDVIIAIAMAALNGIPIAGLVLTGELPIEESVKAFCMPGFQTGLPVFWVPKSSYETATALYGMSQEIPADDTQRIRSAMEFAASHLDERWLTAHRSSDAEPRMSPAAFCYQLTERAKLANRRILLPEGDEPRTIKAAVICQERRIARCVLMGKPDEIRRVAHGLGLELPADLEIIDVDSIREHYVAPLVEMRKSKGLSEQAAADQLTDNVVLGTVMLAQGEADGLVSGAVHSTANTIRPALQLIKTKPGVSLVSSVFFMCLPDQVVVYGDCAVVTDPDAQGLAEIAIQSADSAKQFGITPRVALISYSTGTSGSGVDVDKVREAVRIARELRPDLLIDGPLQYDAASTLDVAQTKAPDSAVAGKATVFVFPDLNTGNTTYKAVQRSANVVSIGPMLQGLKRPVNDLSRGALIDDIVYTIALTAVQATQS